MGFIWALMAVRDEANANGEIVLVMDLVGSRNLGLNLDLARAGVKTGPYVSEAALRALHGLKQAVAPTKRNSGA